MSFIQFHTFNISSADLNPSTTHNSLIRSDEGLTLETSAFNLLMVANLPDQLKNSNPKFCVLRPHRRNTTVSLGTNPLVCQNRTTLFVCLFVCLLACLFACLFIKCTRTGRRGVMFDRNSSLIHRANRSCNSKQ